MYYNIFIFSVLASVRYTRYLSEIIDYRKKVFISFPYSALWRGILWFSIFLHKKKKNPN